jgi:alpha-galactosidase
MAVSNGLAQTPPMGWNSYDCFGGEVTEAEVRANADYMAAHLKSHGWEYIVIDIGWHLRAQDATFNENGVSRTGRPDAVDQYGRLLPATDRFPSSAGEKGFKPLADYIHGLGLKFGIHVMPGIPEPAIQGQCPVFGSSVTAADIVYPDKFNCLSPGFLRHVDYSRPGAQAYADSLLAQYSEWGVDFIKMDGIGLPYMPDVAEAMDIARNRCGRRVVLSTSAGYHDYVNLRKHRMAHVEMCRATEDIWDRWPQLDMMLHNLPRWQGWSRPGFWVDADMLPLGRIGIRQHPLNSPDRMTTLTRPEQRLMMSLWCIAQSPLMFGGDLPSNDDWTLSLLTNDEVLAVNQHGRHARPIFIDCTQASFAWISELPGNDSWALGIFSTRPNAPHDVKVIFDEADLPPGLHIRDLWERKDLGRFDRGFTTRMDPHGGRLFKLVRAGA